MFESPKKINVTTYAMQSNVPKISEKLISHSQVAFWLLQVLDRNFSYENGFLFER